MTPIEWQLASLRKLAVFSGMVGVTQGFQLFFYVTFQSLLETSLRAVPLQTTQQELNSIILQNWQGQTFKLVRCQILVFSLIAN